MNLLTIKQFCEKYSWPTEKGLRGYIFRSKGTPLEQAFTRYGKRVLVDPDKFFEILKQWNKNG